ncbi:hypothetical protein BDV12DRAFT_179496 [Aspergillus spectabilis]
MDIHSRIGPGIGGLGDGASGWLFELSLGFVFSGLSFWLSERTAERVTGTMMRAYFAF